jgi:hypothetical protein
VAKATGVKSTIWSTRPCRTFAGQVGSCNNALPTAISRIRRVQPRQQIVQRGGSSALAGKRLVDVTGRPDGADGNGRDARELIRPAGKVQFPIDLGEGGLSEFRLWEVEDVRPGHRHAKPLFQRPRPLGEPCIEVLRLSLRKAKNRQEAGCHHRPDGLQNLDHEAGALDERRATVPVVEQVEMVVEELIDELTVRAY